MSEREAKYLLGCEDSIEPLARSIAQENGRPGAAWWDFIWEAKDLVEDLSRAIADGEV